MIGQVSRYWISEETHWLAVDIVIYDPSLWGKGCGFEASRSWTDYLFRTLSQTVRLDLQTWSGNADMMHLAAKLGYQLKGRFRNARIVVNTMIHWPMAFYAKNGKHIILEDLVNSVLAS